MVRLALSTQCPGGPPLRWRIVPVEDLRRTGAFRATVTITGWRCPRRVHQLRRGAARDQRSHLLGAVSVEGETGRGGGVSPVQGTDRLLERGHNPGGDAQLAYPEPDEQLRGLFVGGELAAHRDRSAAGARADGGDEAEHPRGRRGQRDRQGPRSRGRRPGLIG